MWVLGSTLGSRRSPGVGHGNPLPYSFLENPMDRGARQATVYGVAQSRTRLKRLSSSSSLTSSCGAAESKRLYFCHQLLSQAGFLEEVTFLQGVWCGGWESFTFCMVTAASS